MKHKQLPHYHTILEMADLLHQPQCLIQRMVHAKRCPTWVWLPRWAEPRFASSTIPEWLRLMDDIDLDSLPACPCQLERPAEVFRYSRRKRTEHKADLEIILKCFLPRVAERLRAGA